MGIAHGRDDPGRASSIAEHHRPRLGASIVIECALDVADSVERRAELDLHVDACHVDLAPRGCLPTDVQRLGVGGHGLLVRRAGGRQPRGHPEVGQRFVPDLAVAIVPTELEMWRMVGRGQPLEALGDLPVDERATRSREVTGGCVTDSLVSKTQTLPVASKDPVAQQ